MYIYLCNNALETELKMISMYVAQKLLAELLRFMENIKGIKKKKARKEKKRKGKINLPQTEHSNFTLVYKTHGDFTLLSSP